LRRVEVALVVSRPAHALSREIEVRANRTAITDSKWLPSGARLQEYPRTGIIVQVRRVLAADEKPLHWVGSSKRDFLSFPAAVKEDMGNALGIVQFGGTSPTAKPWKGLGPGVLEIVEAHEGNAYRAVYTVRFEKAVYVLHAFQKKSPSGIRTAKRDVDLVAERLKAAAKDYEDHYGKAKR
jgi:phage-related protein